MRKMIGVFLLGFSVGGLSILLFQEKLILKHFNLSMNAFSTDENGNVHNDPMNVTLSEGIPFKSAYYIDHNRVKIVFDVEPQ